jgi:hypothetical protein
VADGNGIEARVKALEQHKDETDRRLSVIECKLDKVMQIGWGILGAVLVGIVLSFLERA